MGLAQAHVILWIRKHVTFLFHYETIGFNLINGSTLFSAMQAAIGTGILDRERQNDLPIEIFQYPA